MTTDSPTPSERDPGTDRPGPDISNFDIVAKYQELLVTEPGLTKQVAAINALIAALNTVPSTTAHETLEVIKAHTSKLKASLRNPLPPATGTDLITQYIVTSLKEQHESFDAVRQHLLSNSRLFAKRAVEARTGVAEAGWRLVTEGSYVFTYGASRCVLQLLERAARSDGVGADKFRVVYIRDHTRADESDAYVRDLRALGIATAEIDLTQLAYYMATYSRWALVLFGAEVVMQSGGILTRMGTYTIAQAAKNCNIKVYPCVETHKFCRRHIWGQRPQAWHIEQSTPDFTTDKATEQYDDLVDYTPDDYITMLVTENGIKLKTYVADSVLKIYDSFR